MKELNVVQQMANSVGLACVNTADSKERVHPGLVLGRQPLSPWNILLHNRACSPDTLSHIIRFMLIMRLVVMLSFVYVGPWAMLYQSDL